MQRINKIYGMGKNPKYCFQKIIFISLILFTSCSSSDHSKEDIQFDRINKIYSPPTISDSIIIFITSKPDKEYTEIGILSTTVWQYQPTDSKYYDLMKLKASDIGADAIIILDSRQESYTNYTTKQTYSGKVYRAMAIKFKE